MKETCRYCGETALCIETAFGTSVCRKCYLDASSFLANGIILTRRDVYMTVLKALLSHTGYNVFSVISALSELSKASQLAHVPGELKKIWKSEVDQVLEDISFHYCGVVHTDPSRIKSHIINKLLDYQIRSLLSEME